MKNSNKNILIALGIITLFLLAFAANMQAETIDRVEKIRISQDQVDRIEAKIDSVIENQEYIKSRITILQGYFLILFEHLGIISLPTEVRLSIETGLRTEVANANKTTN